DLVVQYGAVTGAVAIHVASGEALTIAAPATIIATGGLTRLYARNSASANMSGDGYALALRAGATLVDMEFVQFFPIGHLAPRLIGMDPIMWDPFRYKLGGRLLNGAMEDFLDRWGGDAEQGRYSTTRDLATYAITKENEAGRGSPHGGAWLSFTHLSEGELRAAFGPVVDKLAANGIDLTRDCIEVSPIAHYHMGGVRVDAAMRTDMPGLLAAGEAVGGANGANRLSGNAITEALAFGRIAGREAARIAATRPMRGFAAGAALDLLRGSAPPVHTAAMVARLQRVMSAAVGPFRTAAGLERAAAAIAELQAELGEAPPGQALQPHDLVRLDWLDLRQMLLVARAVVQAALAREESRGAHQREDFPELREEWRVNQLIRGEALNISRAAVPA
ncbi:MAG: FAD-binding protein, partial [Roseococcus sp.]